MVLYINNIGEIMTLSVTFENLLPCKEQCNICYSEMQYGEDIVGHVYGPLSA